MFGKKAIGIDKEEPSTEDKKDLKQEAAIIIFGRDDTGKSHASSFGENDKQVAIKAAYLMGFKAMAVAQPEIRKIAEDIPVGRVFDSGKAFVPFVKAGVCLALETHLKQFPNQLCKLSDDAIKELEAAATKEVDNKPSTDITPCTDWDEIKVGLIVIAVDDPDDGWWEAKITHIHKSGIGDKTEDMLTLRWLTAPEEDAFVRRSSDVAIFHPAYNPNDLPEGAA